MEKTTLIVIEFPYTGIVYDDRNIDWIIISLMNQKKVLHEFRINFINEHDDKDFPSDQYFVEPLTKMIVYFDDSSLVKFKSFNCELIDHRQSNAIYRQLPTNIKRIGDNLLCITNDLKDIPIKAIPHDQLFLIYYGDVEGINHDSKENYIILPKEIVYDRQNGLQYSSDEYTYKIDAITLQEYEQYIEKGKQQLKGIKLTHKTKNGFDLHDIILQFQIIKQYSNNDELCPGIRQFPIVGRSTGELICDSAFINSISFGNVPEKILVYKRIEKERYFTYQLNNYEFDEYVVNYFGIDKILTYGYILSNFLVIELDEDLFYLLDYSDFFE